MADSKNEELTVEEPNQLQKALKVMAYPIAAATGVFYGHRSARNGIYDVLKGEGVFNDLKRDKINKPFSELKTPSGDYKVQGKLGKINRSYEKGVSEILKQKGYHFTHHYIGDLSRTQMFETAAIAISAASVALGVVLTIADNKSLINKLTFSSKDTSANAQPQVER